MTTRRALFPLLVALLFSGCDVPTEIPRWETRWIAPAGAARIGVAELLPGGIRVGEAGFLVDVPLASRSWTLTELCGQPACAAGVIAPKPPFSAEVNATVPLPEGVQAIEWNTAGVDVEIFNGLSFDPIRPSSEPQAERGEVRVRLDGFGAFVLDGEQRAFAPGASAQEALAAQHVTTSGAMSVHLTVESPAGDVTALEPEDSLSVRVLASGTALEVVLSPGEVWVDTGEQGAGTSDLSGVDAQRRMRDATLRLTIDNPFDVQGELALVIQPLDGDPVIRKPLSIEPGTTRSRIGLTESETRRLLGNESVFGVEGSLSVVDVTVRPDMSIAISAWVEATLEVGGSVGGAP